MTRHPAATDLAIERYRLGELPPAEAAALEAVISTDPSLQAKLIDLSRSDTHLLQDHEVASFVNAVKARATDGPEARRFGPRTWLLAPASLVAAAWIAANLGVPVGRSEVPVSWTNEEGESFDDRLRGSGPTLLVFLKRGDQAIEQLAQGAETRAGDVVQLAYRDGAKNFGVILSIDGHGQVTRHFPLSGDDAAPLQHGGITALDLAYQLDTAPRGERFYFITADQPFPVGQAMTVAQTQGLDPLTLDRLPLDPSYVQASFLLRKE